MNKHIHLVLGSTHNTKRQEINAQHDVTVVAQAMTMNEAIDFSQQYRPSVVILDSGTKRESLAATRQILQSLPGTHVIIIAAEHMDEYLVEAVEAGASGFLPHNIHAGELLSAVRTIAQDKTYFYV